MSRLLAATTVVVLLGLTACTPAASDSRAAEAGPAASLFAVGDTGSVWGALPGLLEGQLAVAAAIRREHARAPVDAFVLLGDNFYPDGLREFELRARILQNVVRPYCPFIEPGVELGSDLGGVCKPARAPVPRLLAIVGNHDLLSEESLGLQREAVPRFVRNWDMPKQNGPVLRELPGGLSLILLLSESPWDEPPTRELTAALRAARGPWRVILGHRPPIDGHPALTQMVAAASRDSGRVVHAYLAGHVHGLVAIRGESPAPALTVIAGSGSHAKLQSEPEYRIEGADVSSEVLGFLRVDAFSDRPEPRLRISLVRTQRSAWLAFLGTSLEARYEVALDGRVERID